MQFGLDNTVPAEISGNNTVTAGSHLSACAAQRLQRRVRRFVLVGWTNHLKLNENWNLTTDVSYSSGNRDETILETYGVGNGPGPVSYRLNSDGYFDFDFGLDFSDPDNFSLMDPGGWGGDRAQAGYLKYFEVEDSLTAIRFDFDRSFEAASSARYRWVNYTDRVKSRSSSSTRYALPQSASSTHPRRYPPT